MRSIVEFELRYFETLGKEARCGAYDRAYTVESCKHEMSLKKLKQIWSDTWPNTTADDYDALERNCKHFAKDMWKKVKAYN